ncbi:hypothetical protein DWU98_03565 [Dyella monticola]|uniref:Uncharacterized protein n=1 Tax=Dyella monticola TaxID=1927958 RepID=A0A370X9I6_9GAMM|nr:hypothetical protein DWU98_03565 [Dyella monticola]
MLSGVRHSCYQEYASAAIPITARVFAPANFSNVKTVTVSRATLSRWTTTVDRQWQRGFARQRKAGFPVGKAAP